MKVPLRFQITEYDCGTVSLLNAFSYLFEREEIPALLVKQIHKYMLDCYDDDGNLGNGGTSRDATNKLTIWITKYTKDKNFNPYYFDKTYYDKDKQVKIVFNKPFTHNRIVTTKRFFSESHKDFSLGPLEKRECVLIQKKEDDKKWK